MDTCVVSTFWLSYIMLLWILCVCSVMSTPWTVARQAPLAMGFSRQEHWHELPFPSPGHLPDPGMEPFLHSQADALPLAPPVGTGVHESFWIRVAMFCVYLPRSGIAGSYGSSVFSFWGTSTLFSIVAAPVYIPISSVGGLPSLHTLSSIYCLQTFWPWPFWLVCGLPWSCEPHCGFG